MTGFTLDLPWRDPLAAFAPLEAPCAVGPDGSPASHGKFPAAKKAST